MTYEELLEENRRLAEENKRLNDEYAKLGQMYDDLSLSYEDALMMYDQAKESIRLESELEVASEIQMAMIPKKFPESTDIDLYASISPAKEVGGDLYDFFVKDDTLYFCIGDVAGKGVPASLLMTVTTSQFRTVSKYLSEPDEMMMAINNQIAEGNHTNTFVTMFIGRLDLQTGHLVYSCGGHTPPVLIDREVKKLPVAFKLPVGAIKGMKYVRQETQLAPGTTLLLFTDGLTEAMDWGLNLFGDDRLKEIAQSLIDEGTYTTKTLIDRLKDAVVSFVNGAPQSDDLTMMAIRRVKN